MQTRIAKLRPRASLPCSKANVKSSSALILVCVSLNLQLLWNEVDLPSTSDAAQCYHDLDSVLHLHGSGEGQTLQPPACPSPILPRFDGDDSQCGRDWGSIRPPRAMIKTNVHHLSGNYSTANDGSNAKQVSPHSATVCAEDPIALSLWAELTHARQDDRQKLDAHLRDVSHVQNTRQASAPRGAHNMSSQSWNPNSRMRASESARIDAENTNRQGGALLMRPFCPQLRRLFAHVPSLADIGPALSPPSRPTGPLLNPRQIDRIHKRRSTRARQHRHRVLIGHHGGEDSDRHISRHQHAMRRPRGPGGQFLSKDEIRERQAKQVISQTSESGQEVASTVSE